MTKTVEVTEVGDAAVLLAMIRESFVARMPFNDREELIAVGTAAYTVS